MNHKQATELAKKLSCVGCLTRPCEPCHYPTHRGMGGAKAGWEIDEWVPLCRHHHDILDRRSGSDVDRQCLEYAIEVYRKSEVPNIIRMIGAGYVEQHP